MKKHFIKTYGCQMNVYDSERMRDSLMAAGYGEAGTAEDADLIVLNTCHIREKAAEKVYSELGRLKALKTGRTDGPLIAVAGCVAQAEGEEILRRAPAVDLVFGPQSYHRLPELVTAAELAPTIDIDFPEEDKFDRLPKRTVHRPSAFLTVQEGCDKFCTFCVVPYTRGAETSRPLARVLDEAKALADAGVREITLLGQNVNAYHGADGRGGTASLADLLATLAELGGVERLRYTTSHPKDMDDSLIAAHRDLDQLMPYLHLPVQAGSDRVLAAMNRHHDAATYLDLIDRIRAARPDIALSGDFIVGFPGETEADFAATLDLVEKVRYASAFSFKYSPRPGTPGAEREDQIPESEKSVRLHALQQVLSAQQAAFNAATVGKTLDVLIESEGRNQGQIAGRSPYLQAVHLDGPADLIGAIVTVAIETVTSNSLGGRIDTEIQQNPARLVASPPNAAATPKRGSTAV